MIRELDKLLGPMKRRIALVIGRAIIRLVDDATGIQGVQVTLLAGEIRNRVDRFQEYGFTSVPLDGMEALVAFIGGRRDHGVIVAVGDREFRLKGLRSGEVALYDDLGQVVHLTRDGIIVSTAQTLRLEAADIVLHASGSYSWDVDGYGQRVTSLGGGHYEIRTWQQGAVVTPVTGPINPPEGP